jgi:dCMP deaminase
MKNKEFIIHTLLGLKEMSKCISRKVGAIIVKDNRIISTGYNGTLSGATNCCDYWEDKDPANHHRWSLMNEIHAEQNAIAIAAKNGISLEGTECWSSLQPCNSCLLLLVQCGIKKIFYLEDYDKSNWDPELLETINKLGVHIEKIVINK